MAYRLGYSDYLPPAAPPAPAVVPPTPESIPGGPSFIGLPQPPDVPCDPTGDGWRGPPGPPGPSGVGVFLPLAGGTMTGALLLRGDPAASLEAASKHYVDQQTAVGTPPGGPFLALTGGTLYGNLTINKTTTYAGTTASLSDAALNIVQTSSGNITGTGEVDHNSLVITDTLSVNPPANTIASFQAQIDGTTLSLNSLASPPVAVTFTGSISGNTLTILSGIPGLAPGATVQWSGGTDMVQIAAGPGLWTLYNTHGTVSSQAMTGLLNTFSVMASISGSTLTVASAYGPGAITAGMQVQWNLPTPGATTIVTGPAGGPYTLVNPSGTIPLQPMLLLGPQPAQTVTWDSGDPDNPGTATVGSYITGHPAQFSLLTNQGTVSSRPMQTVKAIQNRNVFGFSSYLNFGGGDGSRYGWRLNISQTAAMAGHAYYLPAYIVNNLRYPSGGTDLWAGAKGAGWVGNTVMNFIKPTTTAVGDPGPINYRGGSSWEFDYQCLAGSPDDPAWPKASTASLGGIAVIRGGQSTWETPMWEADYAIAIAQAGPSVRDASNNIVPAKAAKYGIRFNGLSGVPALDRLHGRAIAAVYPPGAFATDGSLGLYPNVAPFGVDWLSMDYTRAAYRWRGGAVLGSATPLPGALAIGGGYLSATDTTVSLDTAGSVCTGATVAPGQGGANCYLGMVCQDDVSGTQVVVTGVDGAVSPRIGAATTVSLIARTGQSHNAEIPTNPVQFRPMGNPQTFLAPGPTGPKLTLTWTAPTTLALQPSGGATVFGGPVNYTATGSTTPRSAQDRAADVVNVRDFGAVFDGNSHPLSAYYPTLVAAQAVYPHAMALTDEIDGVAIQAAINLCQSRVVQYSYGGTVQLPCGNGLVNQPLVISQPCISLASQGNGFLLNSNVNRQIPTAPTRLTWTGAPRTAGQFQANMLTIAPTDGQRQLNATNVQGILFYCNQVAGAAGPLIASVRHAVIDCATHEPAGVPYPGASLTLGSQAITVSSTAGLRLGESVVSASLPSGAYVAAITDATHFNASVQASASSTETVTIGGEGIRFDVVDGLSDTNDTQYIRVRFKGYALAGAVNATAPLVLIGGSGVVGASGAHFGNTSFCWFHDIHCTYKNGHGVVINNSDHNFHDSLLGQNVGSGPGKLLIVNGTLDSGRVARYHVFGHIGDGGLYTGTDTAGFTTATRGHRILFLDRDNGVPNPVIGAGASVLVCSDLQPVLTFTGGTAATPILAQYPDSTAAGGNARAGNAVDLQSSRAAATQVASGVQSVIAGGRNNVASGQWSLVTGGSGNSATAQAASVIAGNNNLASQQFAVAAGNFASADTYMTLAFGSVMVAGRQAQYNIQVLRAVTAANTTPVVLTADLLAPSTINIVNQTAVSGHQCSAISVTLSATDSTNSANSYVWRQQLGLLKKVASAVTYTPVGTPVSGGSGTTTGIAVVEAADNTNKGYTLTFTPPTGNSVVWRVVATVEWTRVDGV